jgi:hypothetical protein
MTVYGPLRWWEKAALTIAIPAAWLMEKFYVYRRRG